MTFLFLVVEATGGLGGSIVLQCFIMDIARYRPQAPRDQKLQGYLRNLVYKSPTPNTLKHRREPESCFLSRQTIVTVMRGVSNIDMSLK